jgi:adenine-specific DNA-methyltransferase
LDPVQPDSGTLPDSLPGLVGAALALGAEHVGPLSRAESRLASEPIDPTALRTLQARIRRGQDPLGEALCGLRAPAVRRDLGAYFTPRKIVEAMIEWAAQGPAPARVIDPGCGSGRFAMLAGARFPETRIVAVELDPVAAIIARANLSVTGLAGRAQVLLEDYRDYAPSPIDGATLYVGNPPYVRHHEISAKWKRWLTDTAGARGLKASRLAGLHAHFFLATATHASNGDRGALITSSEWLDVNYGALMRGLMLDGLGGTAVHMISPQAAPFQDAHVTGAIACFQIGSRPTSVRMRLVKSVAELGRLDGGKPISRKRLSAAERWTPLLKTACRAPQGHIELGELFRVHRGAATGANRVWVVDAHASDLPRRLLRPAVTRARELFAAGPSLASTEGLRAIVALPADLDTLDASERRIVDRFLRKARQLHAHESYIARHRRPWWSVDLRDAPPPILTTYMARRPPAIVRNLAGAHHLNIAHGLYPREPLSEQALDVVAAALRDSIRVGEGRTYAGGLTKFEPKEMERLPIPDVSQLL